MAPEKAKALLAACYALLSGRLLKSATKGMRCYELTSCKLAVCIQIYSIQFNTSEIHHSQIHKIQSRPHRGWDVTLEVELTVYLSFCERLLQYHINTTNITILSSSVKISHIDYVVFKISSRKVFSPNRRSQSTGWDVTSSPCASKCTAEKKLRCAAFGMKGSRKRPARAHTGGKHPSSIFLHSSEYFSTRTQVTNTNKYSSSVMGSHCLLWYLNNME